MEFASTVIIATGAIRDHPSGCHALTYSYLCLCLTVVGVCVDCVSFYQGLTIILQGDKERVLLNGGFDTLQQQEVDSCKITRISRDCS